MYQADERNTKMINAILRKEKAVCPGSIALIGIYGSFANGDTHPRSDLDLLIVANDDRAGRLACAFIQDDISVGHDIYCTSWEDLQHDARYEDPHIAKLMDARIVYCADEKYRAQLEELRGKVRDTLSEPFGQADLEKAENMLRQAQICYASAMLDESLPEVREHAGGALYYIENAVAMLNKTYFRLGTKRRFVELSAMKTIPRDMCDMIGNIVGAQTADGVKESLTELMRAVAAVFKEERERITPAKSPVSEETLRGTYEEMYSNWRGKMHLAAETGDRHLAYMSLLSLTAMLSGIAEMTGIDCREAMSVYDPDDLRGTAARFDALLERYLSEYDKAGVKVMRYPDIDSFVSDYTGHVPAEDRTGSGTDENNNMTTERSDACDIAMKCGDGYFRLRAVGIVIKDGKVLMAHDEKRGYYYAVGGAVRFGEFTSDAAVREIYEETGLRTETDRLLLVQENIYDAEDGTHHQLQYNYLMKDIGSQQFKGSRALDLAEECLEWLDIDRLPELRVYPQAFCTLLKELPEETVFVTVDDRKK